MNILTTTRSQSPSVSLRPIAAAIIGAICTDAFISIAHHTAPTKLWQFIASAGFGKIAFGSPEYAAIGLVFHLATALIWSYLYFYVWPTINSFRNCVLGGIVLGIVIDVCMDAFMAFRGVLEAQTATAVTFGLITNVIFFGLPVAWYFSRYAEQRQPSV